MLVAHAKVVFSLMLAVAPDGLQATVLEALREGFRVSPLQKARPVSLLFLLRVQGVHVYRVERTAVEGSFFAPFGSMSVDSIAG